jgi:hypothetical protein
MLSYEPTATRPENFPNLDFLRYSRALLAVGDKQDRLAICASHQHPINPISNKSPINNDYNLLWQEEIKDGLEGRTV